MEGNRDPNDELTAKTSPTLSPEFPDFSLEEARLIHQLLDGTYPGLNKEIPSAFLEPEPERVEIMQCRIDVE